MSVGRCSGPTVVLLLLLLGLNSWAALGAGIQPVVEAGGGMRLDPLGCLPAPWGQRMPRTQSLEWTPEEGRYLLPMCRRGRLSNQMRCMHMYTWYAAYLGRTLIVPRYGTYGAVQKGDYAWRWDVLLDVPHARVCLQGASNKGPYPNLVTVDEFLHRQNLTAARGALETSTIPDPCIKLETIIPLVSKDKALWYAGDRTISGQCDFTGSTEVLVPVGSEVSDADMAVLYHRTQGVRVLSLGSVFYEKHEAMEPRGIRPFPLNPGCRDIWRPSAPFLSLVDRAVAQLTHGKAFSSMHLRRGDFKDVDPDRNQAFFAIEFVGRCLASWLRPQNVSVLFLATDADKAEVTFLRDYVREHLGRPIELSVLGAMQSNVAWQQDLQALEYGTGNVVFSFMDMYISAKGKAFLGTPRSSFSEEIMRIRVANEWTSCLDATMQDVRKHFHL